LEDALNWWPEHYIFDYRERLYAMLGKMFALTNVTRPDIPSNSATDPTQPTQVPDDPDDGKGTGTTTPTTLVPPEVVEDLRKAGFSDKEIKALAEALFDFTNDGVQATGAEGLLAALPALLSSKLGTTALFRAVTATELKDMMATGAFKTLPGQEVKYFATTARGAASYAEQATRAFGDGPFTIVRTSIPTRAIQSFGSVDPVVGQGAIQTVVVPTQSLPLLSTPTIVKP
jgi:hypothetical protein